MSSTSEDTIDPKAPPMITATAKSTMLPDMANVLNSLINDINIFLNDLMFKNKEK
jgi:hypothetical protein